MGSSCKVTRECPSTHLATIVTPANYRAALLHSYQPLHHSSYKHISRAEILEPAVGAPNARDINVQQMWSCFLTGIELLIPRCFWQAQHQTRQGKRRFVTYYVISLILAYLNLPRCRVVVPPCGRIRREFDQVFGTDGRKISSCRTKSTREQMA